MKERERKKSEENPASVKLNTAKQSVFPSTNILIETINNLFSFFFRDLVFIKIQILK